MSAAKRFILPPDEKYLQDALKEGRATMTEVSMKAIGNPDASLQARVQHLDMEHVRRLGLIHDQTGTLAPIVIFKAPDSKQIWLADGFHRHRAYQVKKEASIPAYVVTGTRKEALEFSTMCNRTLCLPRRQEDILKALAMLFEEDDWLRKADMVIAQHVGCSAPTVARERATFCNRKGIQYPTVYTTANGQVRSRGIASGRPKLTEDIKPSWKTSYRASVDGKFFSLGTDRPQAEEKLTKILEDTEPDNQRGTVPESSSQVMTLLARRGIKAESPRQTRVDLRGLSGLVVRGRIVVWSNLWHDTSLAQAVGQGLLLRQAMNITTRVVLLCPMRRVNPTQAELARELGVDLMTIDELAKQVSQKVKP